MASANPEDGGGPARKDGPAGRRHGLLQKQGTVASDDVQMEQINVRLEQQSMLDPDERQAEAAAAHERVSRASSTSNRRAPSKDDSLSSTHTQSAVTETRVDDTDTDSLATSNGSKRASVILAGVTTRSSSSDMSPILSRPDRTASEQARGSASDFAVLAGNSLVEQATNRMISAMTVFDSESESESDPADTGADTGSAADDATRSARVGALPNLSSSPNKGSFRRGVHPAAVAATGGGSSNSGGGEHGLDSGADVEPERRRRTYSKSCFQRLGKTNKDRMESVRWLDRAFGERSTFGTIRFPNHNKATFVRLSPNTDPKDMIDLMVKLNYSLPRLIISVTGGALDFELSKTVETVLKRGLRKAAEATDSWIITGGTNCGIMKYVGEAMAEIQDAQLGKKTPLIGIATWGVIKQRQMLKEGFEMHYTGSVPASPAEAKGTPFEGLTQEQLDAEGKRPGLDKNHKHFFLVDDGSEGCFGREIQLKDSFELVLRQQEYKRTAAPVGSRTNIGASDTSDRRPSTLIEASLGLGLHAPPAQDASIDDKRIYAVVLVVEGGPNTFEVVSKAVESRTPVVVLEGSGRAADLLSYAWRFLHDDSTRSQEYTRSELRRRIRTVFPKMTDQAELEAKQKEILEVVMMRDRIHVYSLQDSAGDIDEALLTAIMASIKASSRTKEGKYERHMSRFHLSMAFDRVSIARSELKALQRLAGRNTDMATELRKELEKALLWALEGNRVEFVKLLTPQLDVARFLYENNGYRLTHLFLPENNIKAREYFPRLIKGVKSNRKTIFTQGRDLTQMDKVDNLVVSLIFTRLIPTVKPRNYDELLHSERKTSAEIAFHDLMTWSVIMNHYRLAEYFWAEGGRSIPNALFASRLFIAMSHSEVLTRHGHFRETVLKMERMSKKFETLALGVLDECHLDDSDRARKILRVKLNHFRLLAKPDGTHLDPLEIAIEAENQKFVSHPACQLVLEEEWYGDIDPMTSNTTLYLNILLPIALIFFQRSIFTVKLKKEFRLVDPDNFDVLLEDGEETADKNAEVVIEDERDGSGDRAGKDDDLVDEFGAEEPENWLARKARLIKAFYTAPITKFYFDVLSFCGLLILHSAVTLGDFDSSLHPREYLLVVWMIVMAADELRQVYSLTFIEWSADSWNRLDFAMYGLYFVALAFRIRAARSEETYDIRLAKALFAINVTQVFLRSLRIYAVNSTLGPKLIILRNMFSDIFTFIALFFVFLFSYGIATQAVLFPFNSFDQQTMENVVYRPFFQLFGELFLEDIQEDTLCIGPWPFSSCGNALQWLVPLFTAIYLIIANIMLINLLIAMFTRTYESVEDASLELWRFQFEELLMEYRAKPVLPHPLSIFHLLWMFLKFLPSQIRHLCCGYVDETAALRERSEEESEWASRLERFQEKHTERYLEKRSREAAGKDSAKLNRLEDVVSGMRGLLTEIHSQTQRLEYRQHALAMEVASLHGRDSRGFARGRSISHTMSMMDMSVDEDFGSDFIASARAAINGITRGSAEYSSSPDRSNLPIVKIYQWKNFEAPGFPKVLFYVTPLARSAPDATPDDRLISIFETEIGRVGLPPRLVNGEIVRRQVLTDEQVSWDTPMPEYDPPYYTAPYVLIHTPEAPCLDGPKCTPDKCTCFRWAMSENIDSIERSKFPESYSGHYFPEGDQYPRNPVGRTGLRGRGLLGSWGPNRALDYIITRFKTTKNGVKVERAGRPVLECVLVKRMDSTWALTGGFRRMDGVLPILRKAFGLDPDIVKSHEELKELENVLRDPARDTILFRGGVDDVRNTDNAWVESEVHHVHDDSGVLSKFELVEMTNAGVKDVTWAVVHGQMRLFADHIAFLKMAARAKNAYF